MHTSNSASKIPNRTIILCIVLIPVCLLFLSSCTDAVQASGQSSFLSMEVTWPDWMNWNIDSATLVLSNQDAELARFACASHDSRITVQEHLQLPKGSYSLSLLFLDSEGECMRCTAGTVETTTQLEEQPALQVLGRTYITSLPSSVTFTEGSSWDLSIAAYPSNATIYYTTDGSSPTAESNRYSGPITISDTTTIKAIASAENHLESDIACGTYTKRTGVSITLPSTGPEATIVTNDYRTFAAVLSNEIGIEETSYSWRLFRTGQSAPAATSSEPIATFPDLQPSEHFRLVVQGVKGNQSFSKSQSFIIPARGAHE